MTGRDVKLVIPGHFPELDTLVKHAAATFAKRRFVCRHPALTRSVAGALVLCGVHPHLGLLCVDCFRDHLPRHDAVEELRCDLCGEAGDTIHPITTEGVAYGLEVRRPRGSRGLVFGPVVIGGFGVCPPCWQTHNARESA